MDNEFDLMEIFKYILGKALWIIITIVVFAAFGFVYTKYFQKPMYTAKATMILAQSNVTETTLQVNTTDLTLNDKLIATYKELAKSSNVVRTLKYNLKLDISEDELKSNINVTAIANTQMLSINVSNANPELAAKISNELTRVFISKVKEIYNIENISVVDEAEIPTSPSNISTSKTCIKFGMIGFLISMGVIFVIKLIDNTVDNTEAIENSIGLPVLAELPQCDFEDKEKKIIVKF